jgi:hypothetical protein
LDVVNGEGFDIAHVIPESIKKRTLQYLTDCDFITNWFMESYEKTEDGKGLVHSNMSKQVKRTYTKSYFIEKNNIFLKSHYKERETRIFTEWNKRIE